MISLHSATLRSVQLAAMLTRLDSGAGHASLRVYSTTPPSTIGSRSDTPMATLTLTKPSGSIASGALTLTIPDAAMVLSAGTPKWAELVAGDGAILHMGDVTDDTSGGFYRATGADTPVGETSPYFMAGGMLSIGSIVLS